MLKAFLKDSAVYGIAKLVTGSIALLTLPIFTRTLAPADFGIVDLLATVAAVAHVTIALEVSQGFARYVLSPEAAGFRERYTSTALWFTVAMYSLFVALALPLAGWISATWLGTPDHADVVRVAMLVIWSTGLFYLVQNILRYARRVIRYAFVSLVFASASVGVTVWLLLVAKVGLVGVFGGQLVAGLGAVGLGLWLARDHIHLVFDRSRLREMLTFSLPLVPSSVGVLVTMYVDRYAIVQLMTLENLGFYGVAFRLASIVGVALAGFVASVSPLIYQHYEDPRTPAQLARIFQWFLALAIPLVLFLGLFSRELVRFMSTARYLPAAPLVVVLCASITLANCYTFAPGLWIAKRTGWVAAIGLSSGVLNLALNFLLIPRFGLIGAAMSNIVSAFTACSAYFISGQALYRVPYDWRKIGAAVSLVIVVAALAGFGVFDGGSDNVTVGLAIRVLTWLSVSLATTLLLVGLRDLEQLKVYATLAVQGKVRL
jgi:O-antigen/teichoic acid export membrane protein